MKKKEKSKFQKVVDHLESGKTLTKLDSLRLYGYWNLSDLVYKLKKRHDPNYITTNMIATLGGEYAEYVLTNQDHLKHVCNNCIKLIDDECSVDKSIVRYPLTSKCNSNFKLKKKE